MVGLLGCGCCACCAEPTSKWTADFATTPAVGAVWDEVTEIAGAGTRSYAPVRPTGNFTKISRLTIDADQMSPLYHGFPFGADWIANFSGPLDTSNSPKSTRTWKAPAVSAGQRHIMRCEIYTELIYNVGNDEMRTGIYTMWQKNFDGSYSGATVETYTLHLFSYLQINGGARTKQREYGPTTVSYSTSVFGGPRPIFYTEHSIDRAFSGGRDFTCKSFYDKKSAFTDFWRNAGNVDRRLGLDNGTKTSVNDQVFDCFVGWNSEVHWTTVRGSGMGVPVGFFDFDNYYIEWNSASWK